MTAKVLSPGHSMLQQPGGSATLCSHPLSHTCSPNLLTQIQGYSQLTFPLAAALACIHLAPLERLDKLLGHGTAVLGLHSRNVHMAKCLPVCSKGRA